MSVNGAGVGGRGLWVKLVMATAVKTLSLSPDGLGEGCEAEETAVPRQVCSRGQPVLGGSEPG